jgi:DNA polymerase elongation subunit (family B)
MTLEEGIAIGEKFEDTMIFDDEAEMLSSFLYLIEDVDVLSGWNSEGYDIPYLVNRVKRLLGNEASKRFCLWDQFPRTREYLKFGKAFNTYDLVGRVHLDYLLLYQKHNPQQLHSYRLDYVAEIEVGDNKVPYEGTLDDLYKKDFEKFIDYNRQDVALLVKIDAKRKFIELANQIAHSNCVLLKTTMGSVALVEQAIINEMHNLGFVVPDRVREEKQESLRPKLAPAEDDDEDEDEDDERTPVVGAYVAKPKTGIHREVACVDINSLYPSCIRALNMSPETIFGQVRPDETMALVHERIAAGVPRAEAWEGLFCTLEVSHMMDRDDAQLTVDFEDGSTVVMTGSQLYDLVYDPASSLCITANGTLFRTDKEGIIPQLLAQWYSERQSMQAKEAAFKIAAGGVEIDDELAVLLAN